jgi:hypothetical protein
VAWTLTYDHITNDVIFTVGDSTLQWQSPLSGFTDIFVRTRAVVAESEILVNELTVDAEAANDSSYAVGADGLDILWISGASIDNGFIMAGQTMMTWGAVKPTQSKLAFQIKVGKTEPTSAEPTTWGTIKALYR